MTDTLANLSQQIEKDLQQIERELPKFDSCMKCPLTVLKGEEWDQENSTQIKLAHQTVEYMNDLGIYIEVGNKVYLRNGLNSSTYYIAFKFVSLLWSFQLSS